MRVKSQLERPAVGWRTCVRACWRSGLVSHVAKLPGSGCVQVSAANLLGRAGKFATAQRGKFRSASPKNAWPGLGLAGMPRQQQVVKQRLGLCGRAWYSIFVACKQSSLLAGAFTKLFCSLPSFQPIFPSSARSSPMQRANICAQRDGLVARGGSSATRKRALRPTAQVGPLTRPPLAQVVSLGGINHVRINQFSPAREVDEVCGDSSVYR